MLKRHFSLHQVVVLDGTGGIQSSGPPEQVRAESPWLQEAGIVSEMWWSKGRLGTRWQHVYACVAIFYSCIRNPLSF